MQYIDKLRQFNSTEKYIAEMEFMALKLNPYKGERLLDFGCGIGTMVEWLISYGLNVKGHDVYLYHPRAPQWWQPLLYSQFDKIYMMHSLAHIEHVFRTLVQIRENILRGELHILTPNKAWLDLQNKEGYIPDPTVIEHYNETGLRQLLQGAGYGNIETEQQGITTNNERERLYAKATP